MFEKYVSELTHTEMDVIIGVAVVITLLVTSWVAKTLTTAVSWVFRDKVTPTVKDAMSGVKDDLESIQASLGSVAASLATIANYVAKYPTTTDGTALIALYDDDIDSLAKAVKGEIEED